MVGMKQRIRVAGIIRRGEDVLLLKKKTRREVGLVFWELPIGKIKFGEQPEEAMARAVFESLGLQVTEVVLKDAVTFLAFLNSSQMANLCIVYEVKVNSEAKIHLGEGFSAYKWVKKEEFGKISLDDASRTVLGMEVSLQGNNLELENANYRETVNGATIYVDGSSRGNPGPAGIGYYIVDEEGRAIERGGEFVGFATSRLAEYYALKKGVEKAIELKLKSVKFVGDNLMMINQMNGIYKIKNNDLVPVYKEIRKLVSRNFEAVSFTHVKREQNVEADREANLAIDRHFDKDMIK